MLVFVCNINRHTSIINTKQLIMSLIIHILSFPNGFPSIVMGISMDVRTNLTSIDIYS